MLLLSCEAVEMFCELQNLIWYSTDMGVSTYWVYFNFWVNLTDIQVAKLAGKKLVLKGQTSWIFIILIHHFVLNNSVTVLFLFLKDKELLQITIKTKLKRLVFFMIAQSFIVVK